MLCRSRILSCVVLLVLTRVPVASATVYPPGFDPRARDPLLYGQVVVEGIIADVQIREVNRAKLGLSEYGPNPWIARISFGVHTCLRGACVARLEAEPFVDWRKVVGARVLLCADWLASLNDYFVREQTQVFIFKDGFWERMAPPERVSSMDMQARMESLRPEALAERADVVVTGRIIALSDSVVAVDAVERGRIQKYTVVVTSAPRSGFTGKTVRFNADMWEARFPLVKVGEQWMVFLERRGNALWVKAGTNGMLKVGENDQLLYDGVAPAGVSRTELERGVRETRH